MPSTIFGLPLHPLLVHATVVFAAAFWWLTHNKAGTAMQVARVGHSGAEAAWSGPGSSDG